MEKQYHYIYKIIRFDGKYYFGYHSTNNLDDGYFGSGRYLKNSIKCYGLEKHSKEIIEFLPDIKSLKLREAEIVNHECLEDKLCMNLKLGGEGGFDYINNNNIVKMKGKKHTQETIELMKLARKNQIFTEEAKEKIKINNKRTNVSRGKKVSENLTGKPKTQEHKNNLSKSLTGYIQIKNKLEGKRIHISELDMWLDQGWVRGRFKP